jgi:hypothetical protein
MRKEWRTIGGPAALAVGVALGAGLALFLWGCPWTRRAVGEAHWQGQAGEGGEETSYDDTVDTAVDESFPASDPPSYSAPRRTGRPKQT